MIDWITAIGEWAQSPVLPHSQQVGGGGEAESSNPVITSFWSLWLPAPS